ncbi:bifunctional 5,10-methylene-tetrahydrofolate dehydrogenase/5,10-methylene-tetrahydrofolate cyclohydrolase [Arthrobacter sp. MYb211]|uniref:bifunctional 5,10-methylenetetrahydrofolate dehydrogenase/5,10-methenyltetrahydrofolate cyclohydrolase n=1 Tax=Micrococcaceae TaxID=1268 RepID=UPI000CFD9144|nr:MULTISPECIES: tetrahydrofolate dehydrogenase/cyclohydrolase catalytic domain-containing protein [unclassified Arthrobacter]PRA00122.1 bifunctional 5,10-methylene-tetrahydrofolate dehydrogenase/5,10-methylene-tetrahydrofolate cyclohydrolase [Arthrobacter sp. MYb224]PRA04296.1 bifunctional 5,10-methylene-tetrahydrofolate dehydrogenase/5,10-methylene-tetrahydrofolate cyclohydrolase [Arthrobacter sp. MYb229]PRA10296.1 bifunctional 5,10-methylene-tetrahydrofolate dehydrogenase/5,10-methylene-tetra
MTAQRLAGQPVAAAIRERTGQLVSRLASEGITARVAVVLATDNEATSWYVRSIERAAERLGVHCQVLDLATGTQSEIAQAIRALNADETVHGIILQTPLPESVDPASLVQLIDPAKDIDGANPLSLGRLSVGQPAFAPATARSVIEILEHYQVPLAGEHVAVVGRSAVVGKPLAQLLLQRDATVSICHSRTTNLAEITRGAAVTVVAVGRANLLTGNEVSDSSVVIDVGTNVTEDGQLVGDVHAESVQPLVRAMSPVPGGVGTVTTALLILHATQAALAALENAASKGAPMAGRR